MDAKDFDTPTQPNWCPGCGDYAIHMAVKQALAELGLEQHNVLTVSGIGCSAKLPHWVNTYGYHSIHGRALPVASGAKIANHKLTVMTFTGDGDCYGIGMGHFMHACRRNLNITSIVHNNQIYGLTKGQMSPTSAKGTVSVSTPFGSIEEPVNPIAFALAAGCRFIARTFAGDLKHLVKTFKAAIQHKGYALVDVLQPCVTFNKVNTYDYFRKRVYDLQEKGHDASDYASACAKAEEFNDKIPIGIFYKGESVCYTEQLPQLKEKALVEHKLPVDTSEMMNDLI